jgi:hypothetical protein
VRFPRRFYHPAGPPYIVSFPGGAEQLVAEVGALHKAEGIVVADRADAGVVADRGAVGGARQLTTRAAGDESSAFSSA